VNETSSEIESGSAYYCDDHLVVCRLLLGHRSTCSSQQLLPL
jgi:hypothetical protein